MLLRLFLSVTLITYCGYANSKVTDDIYINGFIGVGYMHESANNFIDTEKDSNKIIEGALNFTYEYNGNFSILGQAAYREFGEYFTDKTVRIDYANVNYTSSFIFGAEQSISVGRVKVPMGVYNTSRDIPTSRPSIIMAQSAYLDIFRNLMISTDGLLISSSHEALEGVVSVSASYGKINIDDKFTSAALGSQMKGSWEEGNATVFDIRYSSDNSLLGFSYNNASPNYLSTEQDLLPIFPVGNSLSNIAGGQIDIESYLAFLQYRFSRYEFTSEYTYRKITASGFTPTPPTDRPMEGFYAQLKYAASPSLNVMVRFDKLYRYADQKNGYETPIGVDPSWYNNAETTTLNINYSFDHNWSVIADIHYIEGSAWLPPFSYQEPASVEKKHWLLSAVEVVYVF